MTTTDGIQRSDIETAQNGSRPRPSGTLSSELYRGLKARQVAMIAIGGAIGTGLIIGTGNALSEGGPASVFIAYTVVGFVVWLVMTALGEMAVWLPISQGFSGYAARFCDPALGFALGWTYWIKYIILVPNQLTAAAMIIQYWVGPDKVNPGVFITIFLVTIVFINYFGIQYFGEFEFWLSSIKVLTLCGLIILSLILACGGGPIHEKTGFQYWKIPGAFRSWNDSDSGTGKFIAFWYVLGYAVFAYLGTELIGVTVGEARNPRKTIPRAIKLTFFRILIFYCLSVLLLGMIIPYDYRENANWKKFNNPQKKEKRDAVNANGSPFVMAIKHAEIPVLPGFLNVCILLFVFSASNSDLYIASRTIYGLAIQGQAPRFLARTNSRGVPTASLLLSSVFASLAYINTAKNSNEVFKKFVDVVSSFGLLAWISILVSHICFVRAREAQGVRAESIVYKAPLGIWGSYCALFFCCFIALTKAFPSFVVKVPQPSFNQNMNSTESHGEEMIQNGTSHHNTGLVLKFDTTNFITGYISIPIFLTMLFGYKYFAGTKTVNRFEADLLTGKDEIDQQEIKYLEARESEIGTRRRQFYKRPIGWLF